MYLFSSLVSSVVLVAAAGLEKRGSRCWEVGAMQQPALGHLKVALLEPTACSSLPAAL